MSKLYPLLIVSMLSITLIGCNTLPQGPALIAQPGSNKTLNEFDIDDRHCQNQALKFSGGKTPNQVKEDTIGQYAMVGTIIGALMGAVIGGSGESAAIGAASGIIFAGLAGNDEGELAGKGIQYKYDNAYINCMYSAGHRVPVKIKYIQQPATVNITIPAPTTVPYGVPPDFRPAY